MEPAELQALNRRLDYLHDAIAKVFAFGLGLIAGYEIHAYFNVGMVISTIFGATVALAALTYSSRFWRRMGGNDHD